MANPYLGYTNLASPNAVTDHVGDETYYPTTYWHVVGMLVMALLILTALKVSGFRAMVGIGRG